MPFGTGLLFEVNISFVPLFIFSGDAEAITIGDNVTIGDRALIQIPGLSQSKPTTIGDNVTVGK